MDNTISKIQCGRCHKYFVGASIHEMHRVGDYSSRTSRRCLTTEEMRAKGMDAEKKNVRIIIEGKETYQEHDIWFNVAAREAVQAHFAGY